MNYNDTEVFNRSFRKLLIELRKRLFFTQTDLSRCAGITRQAISMMECGRRVASFQTFCEIAQGIGISPAELMNQFERICEMEYAALGVCSERKSRAVEYVRNARKASGAASRK